MARRVEMARGRQGVPVRALDGRRVVVVGPAAQHQPLGSLRPGREPVLAPDDVAGELGARGRGQRQAGGDDECARRPGHEQSAAHSPRLGHGEESDALDTIGKGPPDNCRVLLRLTAAAMGKLRSVSGRPEGGSAMSSNWIPPVETKQMPPRPVEGILQSFSPAST